MTWHPKYRTEFCDILGLQWTIDIESKTDPGVDPIAMKATGDPLNIEYFSDSEELFDSPVKGSKADLTIYSETDFQWIDIYSSGDFEYRMSIYAGAYTSANLYWQGYILAESYSEPYDGVSYPVTISAGDGLGILKNIKYDNSGTYYNGRKTQSQIIYDILLKIQFTGFTEYLNIYESRMDQTATDSPLDQALIDVDLFKDMYCYEVLQEILKSYNALIRQVAGVMVIYRPTELDQAVVNGRTFSDGTTISATPHIDTEQFINRTTTSPPTPSDRLSIDGGNLKIVPSAKNVKLNQDYGYKNNWFDNGEFKGSSFDATRTTEMFEFWTNTASALRLITNELYLSDEPDGAVIPANVTPYTYEMSQVFGNNAIVSTTDVLMFEFKYLHSNYYGSDIKYVRISMCIRSNTTGNYLHILNDTYMGWSAASQDIDFGSETVHAGNTGWKSFQRKIVGIPEAGPYTISIYNSFNLNDTAHIASITTAFKDVKFYATSDEIQSKTVLSSYFPFIWTKKTASIYVDNKEMVGKEIISVNATNGIDIEYNYKLGDVDDSGIENVTEQFQGCLTLDGNLFTEIWNTISPGGDNAALLSIISGEIQTQYSRPQQLLSIPIREGKSIDNLPHINLIGNFQDSLNLISGNNRIFVFGSGDFNVKMRIWNISLIELVKIILS